MREETWKAIQGYEGSYEVSSDGRVRSLSRKVVNAIVGEYTHSGRARKLRVNASGYVIVGLNKCGRTQTHYVHRLVATAFIETAEGRNQVNHIDGDKRNNHASNLEWCTAKENLKHALDSSLREMPSGLEHWKNKGNISMTKEDQQKFYATVGKALTAARQQRNMSIAQLSTKSKEQHKTIRGIEAGRPCSLHHAVWMRNILGIDLNAILREHMEGISGKKEDVRSGGVADFI